VIDSDGVAREKLNVFMKAVMEGNRRANGLGIMIEIRFLFR
jgi:hypothetical protein